MVEQIQKKFPELKEVYAVQESWLAKLGHWDEALVKYNQKLATSHDSTVLAGKMKCLDALGRWEEAIQICEENLEEMRVESDALNSNKTLVKAAVIGARAAWSLNQWDKMDLFLTQLPGMCSILFYF